ncbi:uncharacterized protein JCM6883_000522 [Sporobolomyces salmoneus]|uniref:uncharacterized protein n=1 Tax=Sporobolomyces salmoneus TaxID=183962 RepID=UPI003176F438
MSSITEKLTSFAESIAYPNKETHLGANEHDAAHGATLVDNKPAEGVWDRLHGENTLRQIRAQGDCGQGMEDGLGGKATRHQEEVAERSRLAREGLFEPHKTHDALTNLSEEHRDVASGSKAFGGTEEAKSAINESLKDGGIGRQVLENQKMNS